MCTVGLRPKQSVDQNDYHEIQKGKVQVMQNNDMYINLYSTVEQQIRKMPYYLGKFMKESKNNLRNR